MWINRSCISAWNQLTLFSINLLVVYRESVNLIGYHFVTPLIGRVETVKRHNETMKRHDEKTKRHNDEAMWSVMSWTCKMTSGRGQSTNWTDKMTRRIPEAMSGLLRTASRTRKTTTRLEVSSCRNEETPFCPRSTSIVASRTSIFRQWKTSFVQSDSANDDFLPVEFYRSRRWLAATKNTTIFSSLSSLWIDLSIYKIW